MPESKSVGVLDVDVWSDIVCPWCRIGRAHLESALAQFEHADQVRVTYRSFELEPSAPAERDDLVIDQLAAKYGSPREQITGMMDDVTQRGHVLGIDFQFDIARSGNTFDAHRLLHMAQDRGSQHPLLDLLMHAYFTEGRSIGDRAVLADIAVASGLDRDEVEVVLASDAYADAVRADEEQARALQITGVPFFVFDHRLAASGAQPPQTLLAALRQAWDSRPEAA